MSATTMPFKRPLKEVEDELLNLAAEEVDKDKRQKQKKRRHNFAHMTQYSSTMNERDLVEEGSIQEESPSGSLKKVILRNFMCHENFEMELGPRLNFIVGNNGSGKSAILTAIAVGLGVKASETNRGVSLKDLIREGSYSAKITLYLDNSRIGSYKSDVYGDTIIIERTLKRDGPPSFSLKTKEGEEISSRKKDVQSVLDYFSIPISNPMCFLSQDAARSFLTAGSPHDKYMQFMKGTLLQNIDDDLNHAKVIHKNSEESMKLHLEKLRELKAEYEDAKKLIKEINQTSTLNERKMLLQGRSLWMDIDQNYKAVEKLKNDMKTCQTKIEKLTNKVNEKEKGIEKYTIDNESAQALIEENVINVNNREQEHQLAREAVRNVRAEFEKKKANEAEAQKNIESCKKKIEALDKTIAHLEENFRREMGGDKDQLREELADLEMQNTELNTQVNALTINLQDVQNEEREVVQQRQADVQQLERSIQNQKIQIQRTVESNNNFLSNFDPKMEYLLKVLKQRQREFEVPPIGPLGNYITIKKDFSKWTRAIQKAISSSLSSFVVVSQKDQRLLRDIERSCNMRANIPVISYKLNVFNFSAGRARCQYPTIVDAIEFATPELECLLVDMNKIEKVVLIDDYKEARNFLRARPQNVTMALSLRDQRTGFQLTGGFRLDTIVYEDRIKMKTGTDDGSSYMRDSLNQEMEELRNVKNQYDTKISEKRSQLRDIDRELSNLRQQIKQNNSRTTLLRINIGKVVDTGVLTSKQDERKNQEQAIAGYEAAIALLKTNLEEITGRALSMKEKYDESRTALKTANEELQQLKENVNNRESRIARFKDDIKQYNEKANAYSEAIKRIEVNISSLGEGIESQVRNASKFCSREDADKEDLPNDQVAIRTELEQITRQIRKCEQNLGLSQDKIVDLFNQTRSKYKQGQEKYDLLKRALHTLKSSLEKRLEVFKNRRYVTCLEANHSFIGSMKRRNFKGMLKFDFQKALLDIKACSRDDPEERDVDTLSGGEKSFSQMALLLATWAPMRSRITALDEFDVFMDQVNRKIGTGLIVKTLKDNARTQTIIITPQDIGKIAHIDSTGVNIHRMRDPERQNNSNYFN
ncbi:hypothetical protein KAFR_0A06040 [Kazachstania africana CBS 2517]|uniref:RecF/RecN/SMC N-terminal domain-containing protein n=1 Tax=Kazachstania africana (strain ATCC 22294 / BCRC 22015 / CBS 2517 / CECT 1963 / NBRC 1671 / NRRL Y-8276) TaxID=1071382 RepID=H2ANT9_KAZAF|nr:hypothetical protein KAFR_0A06040 [Kazachstania africana CBS 2517]CCF56039.1 hypothetical protein KAFR_0A06040 [Kazachstania africana CBS 2517]